MIRKKEQACRQVKLSVVLCCAVPSSVLRVLCLVETLGITVNKSNDDDDNNKNSR